jgi:hypothetical protein
VVALTRLGIPEMTPALGASNINNQKDGIDAVVEAIASRAEAHSLNATSESTKRQEVRAQVLDLIDTWKQIANRDKRLQYQKEADLAPPLLLDALSPDADKEPRERQKFKAYRSLRDVEATVNLWIRDPYGLDMEDDGK